jgi:hypothetical protein
VSPTPSDQADESESDQEAAHPAHRNSTGGIDQDGEIVGALLERIEWATPELTAEGFDRREHIHGVLRMIGARP